MEYPGSPANTLTLLEFPRLLSVVSGYSHSEASRKAVLNIRPLGDRGEVEKRLGQVREIMRMLQEGDPLRFS
ncbi:MAG TPA: hypothetical protein VF790_01340, partial [Dissulfurispiraceae bacterium]